MFYGYVTQNYTPAHELQAHIERYAKQKGIQLERFIDDEDNNRVDWQLRVIRQEIDSQFRKGDALVTYDGSCIGRSVAQLIEFLTFLLSRGIHCHFVKYDMVFNANGMELKDLLALLKTLEEDFVAKRTKEALARRKAQGLPLGRPKGRKNKHLKLDVYRADIQRYINLGVSKASVAKIINCHPQTLYNYLDMRNIRKSQ